MNSDITPLIVGSLVFIASLISLRLGLSVAIIEIVLGSIIAQKWFMPVEEEDLLEE
jgi:hypothetical protein